MAKKAAKKSARKRAPGGGRKPAYGQPTRTTSYRLPLDVLELLESIPGGPNAAIVMIIRSSHQYRLKHGEPDQSVRHLE